MCILFRSYECPSRTKCEENPRKDLFTLAQGSKSSLLLPPTKTAASTTHKNLETRCKGHPHAACKKCANITALIPHSQPRCLELVTRHIRSGANCRVLCSSTNVIQAGVRGRSQSSHMSFREELLTSSLTFVSKPIIPPSAEPSKPAWLPTTLETAHALRDSGETMTKSRLSAVNGSRQRKTLSPICTFTSASQPLSTRVTNPHSSCSRVYPM